MSTTYNVSEGDTFDDISRRKYGSESNASLISRANPGVFEPLKAGISITIPSLPDTPSNTPQQAETAANDEVAILVDGKRFRFWSDVSITRSIDSMDVVEFAAPFDSNAPDFRETFRPFSYKTVTITVGGELLFTGTMVAVDPLINDTQKTISVSCYSLPGVLNDCTPPVGSPLEFNNLGLKDIATTLTSPFGINAVFEAEQGPVFERVACDADEKVLTFLVKLAKQRNLILSSSIAGDLVFKQSTNDVKPIAILRQGSAPVLSVEPFFSPQDYHSHLTGLDPVIIGSEGSQFTVKNPRLNGVTRPLTFKTSDSNGAKIKATVEAKASRMFANMVSYYVTVSTWRDEGGKLWEPDKIISLIAPDAMIYKDFNFIVRSVKFSDKDIATLNLVLPGAFSGVTPEVLPWDE